jgi:CRP-like cAMP-binding protein
MNNNSMNKNNLFYNIEESEHDSMMNCFNSHLKSYYSGEIISFYSDNNMGIGIIEEGTACVVHGLANGSRTILENLNPGDIFGQLFYFHALRDNITVEATSKCVVRYIDYEHIIKRCSKACAHHSQLVNNILLMVQTKTQRICEHLEVLSQRSIRERLLSYFEILSVQNHNKTFELPFTISNMADYLSVDRSAMSRELSKMKEEGIIRMNKRKVTLL